MALATLSIDLVAKLAQFERDMGKAARVAEQNSEKIRAAIDTVGRAAAGILGGISVGALVALTRAQIDAIDGFNDLADATGASIENVSALDSIARRTGATFESVGGALVKFNDTLKNAGERNKEAGAVLQALGLDVERLKQLDPAEALMETAKAFEQFADDGNKARAVQELFGRSVQEVAPILKDLAENGKLVATTTAAQTDEVDRFNKQIFALQAAWQDSVRQVSLELLPTLNALIQGFSAGGDSVNAMSAAGSALKVVLQSVAVLGSDLVFVFKGIGREIGAIAAQAAAVSRLDFNGAAAIRRELIFDNEAARAELDAYQRRVLGLDAPAAAAPSAAKPSIRLQGPVAVTKPIRGSGTIRGSGPTAETFTLEQKRQWWLIQHDHEEMQRTRKENEDAALAAMKGREDYLRQIKGQNDEIDRLSGRTDDDRKRALTERLEQRLNAGEVFSQEELERIVNGIAGITKATEQSKTLAEELGLTFTSAFEDAIVSGRGLSGVIKGLEQDILRIMTRKMVTEPLGNALTSAFSGVGNGAESFLAGIFGGFRADGGPVTGGKAYWVGERGPEIFRPKTAGAIVPNHQLGGQSISVVNNITISGPVDRRTPDQIASAAAAGAQRALSRNY